MSAATTVNMAAILKRIWPQDDIQDLMYADSPFLAMVPKKTDWSGNSMEIVMQVGLGGGRSSTFTNAKANKSASTTVSMSVTTSDNFCLWSVDHKLMTLSRNDKGAVVRAIESQTKAKLNKFKRSLAWMLYGNGGGSIGTVSTSTSISSTTLKFTDSVTVRRIDKDDVLTFASDSGDPTASQTGVRSGTVTVTAVDEENNQCTVTPALTTGVPAIAVSDYIFVQGDYGATLYGTEAFIPSSAPSSTIFGMARTTNVSRLSGIRVGGKGLLIQEAVKKALMISKKRNASISHILMSEEDFLELELSLGTARRYADEKVGRVGFSGLEFITGNKSVKVFSDPDLKANIIWGLQMDTWSLHSAGDYPDFLNINGNKYEMEESSNSFEGRVGGYAQLYTDAPGFNFRLDRTAT